MNKISVGIIGAGRIGTFHATNLSQHPSVTVKTIYDINKITANKLAKKT
ncbi:Gfo/Idh/MocA family oxidoreductase [Pelagibacteraceae bacterium]|nr:Gfo/Idh/MocA family oxidoreductase [Pelagibacteraceae bacterium]